MKKKALLPLFALLLAGCRTSDLYERNLYNSPVFDKNYYLIYEDSGLGDTPAQGTPEFPSVNTNNNQDSFLQYGYDHALSNQSEKFKTGILSKLYDGRTRCDNLQQLSRVQIDKSGFGTKLPEEISKASKFEFVVRGGSSAETPLEKSDFKFNFFIDIVYEEGNQKALKSFELYNVPVHTDNHSKTTMVSFTFHELTNISYYQMRFKCVDSRLPSSYTDDYTDKQKDHLAIMLYEVLIN